MWKRNYGTEYNKETLCKYINNALKEEPDISTVAKFATITNHDAIEGKTQIHMTERIITHGT